MPDFDKLHDAARRLEELTRPGNREEGLHSWALMVAETWHEISDQWNGEEKAHDERKPEA